MKRAVNCLHAIHRIWETAMSGRLRTVLAGGQMPLFAAAWMAGCSDPAPPAHKPVTAQSAVSDPSATQDPREVEYREQRRAMVEHHLRDRNIVDESVLEAMLKVPRHLFVPESYRNAAYTDGALPIGHDQTISQPYVVALMTQLAGPASEKRALDIGTGSGYQAAVLAEVVREVYSIEIVCPLAEEAADRLESLGYDNVTVRCGDGYQGWEEHAPFDIIIVAAAPNHVPQPLVDQLAPGGRMVIPVGDLFQNLLLIEKHDDGTTEQRTLVPVQFVPMTGQAEE